MKKHFVHSLYILAALLLFLPSCKKGGGTKPVLSVDMLGDASVGGDKAKFDINSSGIYATKGFKVEEDFNGGGKKTLFDTSFESKSVFTYVYVYTIPKDAKKGDQITLYFTSTDSRNNTSTVSRTITVSSSQPILSLQPTTATASAGGQVNLNIGVTSSESNLGKVEVQESRGGQSAHAIADKSWQGQNSVNWTYSYTVPSNATKGEQIILFVVASTTEGGQRYGTCTITVQ